MLRIVEAEVRRSKADDTHCMGVSRIVIVRVSSVNGRTGGVRESSKVGGVGKSSKLAGIVEVVVGRR